MDIHKPKPWHGVREFLKEYVIIVVGVLTALAAEQAVEWLHWQQLSARTEAELDVGLRVDLLNAMHRTAIYPCQRERIVVLAARLAEPAGDWKAIPLPSWPGYAGIELVMPEVFHTPRPAWSNAAWQAALTSGALDHLPHKRVDAYARAYRLVDTLIDRQSDEGRVLPRTAALAYDHKMSEAERVESLKALAELDRMEQSVTIASGWMMSAAKDAQVEVPAKAVADRMAAERITRGACVRDPVIPVPPVR